MAAERQHHARLRAVMLSVMLALFAAPLLITAFASFQLTLALPLFSHTTPSWSAYAEIGIAEPNFWRELMTSTGLSALCTMLAVGLSFPAAHALARSHSRHKTWLLQGCLVLASLPIMAYLIPLDETLRLLRLKDTLMGLVLAQTATFAPLTVYLLAGYLVQAQHTSELNEIEEAAQLDGATPIEIVWCMAWPIARAGVAAASLIIFVLNWNVLLLPLRLAGVNVKTVTVAMSDFFTFERELSWPTAAVALIVSALPLLVVVGVAHRVLEGLVVWVREARD